RIERVHVTRTTRHKQRNDGFGTSLEMRWFRSIGIRADGGALTSGLGRRQQSILVEQIRKRQPAHTATGLKQELATGPKVLHNRSPYIEELAQIQQYVSQISERVRSNQVRRHRQLCVVGRSRQGDLVRQLDLLDRIIAGLFLHAI